MSNVWLESASESCHVDYCTGCCINVCFQFLKFTHQDLKAQFCTSLSVVCSSYSHHRCAYIIFHSLCCVMWCGITSFSNTTVATFITLKNLSHLERSVIIKYFAKLSTIHVSVVQKSPRWIVWSQTYRIIEVQMDCLAALPRPRGPTVQPTLKIWRLSLGTSREPMNLLQSWLPAYPWEGKATFQYFQTRLTKFNLKPSELCTLCGASVLAKCTKCAKCATDEC